MKKDLLVIDDDKFVCKGISSLLEKCYSVNYALSGKEGIEKFKEISPGIVFVDYLLPDIDGLAVVNELKRINQEAHLIFVTGSGSMELVIKALRAGVFDYIEKPIQSEILMASLRRLETFQMLEQQRRRQEVEKEMLVFSLRHELNNFYSIISGNVQLLESEGLSPSERRKTFTAIKTALGDCIVIMNKLKDCVRLKPLAGVLQSVDVNLLVTNVVSSLHYVFAGTDAKAVKIVTELGDCGRIKADPTEIREVLINVLNNAYNAITAEGKITISTSQEKPAGQSMRAIAGGLCPTCSAVIKIIDTGPGIPEGIREKLFRPFASTGGTGVGLFWSRFVVSQYGGTMEVESPHVRACGLEQVGSAPPAGRGATVVIRLPCEK